MPVLQPEYGTGATGRFFFLFPMPFNIYLKQLGWVIQRVGTGCYQYAGDIQFCVSFSLHAGEAAEVLELCLEVVGVDVC